MKQNKNRRKSAKNKTENRRKKMNIFNQFK